MLGQTRHCRYQSEEVLNQSDIILKWVDLSEILKGYQSSYDIFFYICEKPSDCCDGLQ